jgi:hypothetical protein
MQIVDAAMVKNVNFRDTEVVQIGGNWAAP